MIEELKMRMFGVNMRTVPDTWEMMAKINEIVRQVNTLNADMQLLLALKETNDNTNHPPCRTGDGFDNAVQG